jgi:hypothetical protein
MTAMPFGIFDADNHYYEPRDAFSRHLDPRFADRAVKVVTVSGKDTIFVAGQKHHFTPPTFDLVPPPGHLKEMMTAQGEGTAASFLKPMRPEYQHREARLAVMDDQGTSLVALPILASKDPHPKRAACTTRAAAGSRKSSRASTFFVQAMFSSDSFRCGALTNTTQGRS